MKNEDRYQREVVEPNDKASQLASEICRQSAGNNEVIITEAGEGFRGGNLLSLNAAVLIAMLKRKMKFLIGSDGAGHKPEFHAFLKTKRAFRRLGWDLITMLADDMWTKGALPVLISNQVDAKKVTDKNFPFVEALFEGYGKGLRQAGIINSAGEFAIMRYAITGFPDDGSPRQLLMTWNGSCIGIIHNDLRITGKNIRPDQPIVGLWEPGMRCNGATWLIDMLLCKYNRDIKAMEKDSWAREFIEKLTIPSLSYARLMTRVMGYNADGTIGKKIVKIAGASHNTGGGIWGKFREKLPEGIGADLHNMLSPAPVLLEAQEISWNMPGLRKTDLRMCGTTHGGYGAFVICETHRDAKDLLSQAILRGIKANIVGWTTRSKIREVVIESKFLQRATVSSKQLGLR
jgi:phosphoribosylaminoimidazole (AIR) synthetase